MRICPNCNNTSQEAINFCPKCGTAMVEQAPPAPPVQPVYQEPVQPQYQYQQPVYTAAPPSKAKSIVGMALSIAGIAMSSLASFYSLIFLIEEELEGVAVSGILFFFFSFPLSLVGLILSKNYINAGGTNTFSRVGKILGIVGVILSSVMLFFGLASTSSF